MKSWKERLFIEEPLDYINIFAFIHLILILKYFSYI